MRLKNRFPAAAAIAAYLLSLLFPGPVSAQPSSDTSRYEVCGYMPSFFPLMKEALTWPEAWGNSPEKDFVKWKGRARGIVLGCMENLPPAPLGFAHEITASEQRNGYSARKILFNASQWCRVSAYLLVPDGKGPFPAVIVLHDHGAHFSIGKEKVVRPFAVPPEVEKDAELWVEKFYDGVFIGDMLARNGFVVLAVDALYWGERGRREGADYDVQQALASNMLQMGSSWGGFITADDLRSADFLASLDCVDSTRIGCLGFSMGAYRAWMLAALSDRIAVSASVCWMNTTGYLMTMDNNQNKGGSAWSMIVPGLRRFMDYPHVAAIACPRPALFFNCRQDKLFPTEGVEEAYDVLRRTWEEQDAGDSLVTRLWDGNHFFNRQMQEEVLEFLCRWL